MNRNRRRLLRSLEGRSHKKRAGEFSAEAMCFGKQHWAVISPHRRKIFVCGRRSGKTFGIAIALLLAARVAPFVPCLYVTLTRENAREIIWADLLRLNEEFQLGYVVHEGHLELSHPSGGLIQLRGAHTEKEIAKYRGKKFKLVVIDEAQSFPDRILEPLIKEVIGPTLMDYQGSLVLVGTPPPLRRGYFWRCYAGDLKQGREVHRWTVRDNEKFPARLAGVSVDDILAEVRTENGWTEEDPTYQREYEGKDIEDRSSLLFEWLDERNGYDGLPKGEWSYVFGIDLGFDDSMAIAVLGWRRGDRRVYVLEEWTKNHIDITDLAEEIRTRAEKYRPQAMVIDQGGLGKLVAEEIRRRHSLPVHPADKAQKAAHIKLLNADLRKGMLLGPKGGLLAQDAALVRKDPKKLAIGELVELKAKEGGYHSDIWDAALYAWRRCMAFIEQEETTAPVLTDLQRRILAEQRRREAEAM